MHCSVRLVIYSLDIFESIVLIHKCAQQESEQLARSRAPWNRSGEGGSCKPGPPNLKEKSQLEPSRDGGDMRKGKEEPFQDVMQKDEWLTE